MTPRSNRTSFARNRWQEIRAQCVAVLPPLDPLLGRAPPVVEADDRSAQSGDDEADPGKQLPEVMFDLGDDAARAIPGASLVLEGAVADQRRVARPTPRPREQILDLSLQHVIGQQAHRVAHPAAFQRLVDLGPGERGVRPDHDPLPAPAALINDGQQDLVQSLSGVEVSRRTRSGRCTRTALASRGPGSRSCRCRGSSVASACRRMLNQIRVYASEAVVVLLLYQDIRLEPVQRGRKRNACFPSLPRASIRNVGSSASRSASLVSAYPARRL